MTKLATIEPAVIAQASLPDTLLQMALDKGADLDRLEKLMELKERHDAGEARKAYINAMTVFRSSVGNITKDKKSHNSKYASLAHTLDSIKDQLSGNGLSHTWKTEQSDGGLITVTCCVTHQMGHQECTSMSANADGSGSKNSIQAIGSTVSYLQRYTLYAILGLASTDQDDDGGKTGAAVELITDTQANEIHAMITDNDLVMDTFLKWIATAMKVSAIADIPANRFDGVVKKIKASIKAKAA